MRTTRLAAAAGAAALVLAACNGDTAEIDAPAEVDDPAVEDADPDLEEGDPGGAGDPDTAGDAGQDEGREDAAGEDAAGEDAAGEDAGPEDAAGEDGAAATDSQDGFDPDETISLRGFVATVGGEDSEEFPFETLPDDIDLELPAAHRLEVFQGPQEGQWVADEEGEERSGLLVVNVPDADLDALLAFFDEQLAAYGWEETDVETTYTRSVPLADDIAPAGGGGGEWVADAELRLNVGEDDDLPFERTFINIQLALTPTVG